MEKFTYSDYLKYTKINNEIMMLQEETVEYKIEKIHQYKDKGYKIVLEDKEEAVNFINKVLELKGTPNEIQKEEIEKYKNEYITQEFKTTQADIIYKKKGRKIFFLIEQQSKIDYSMPYRIMNYCIEIMRSAIDKEIIRNKNYKLPVIYPVVLYTGKMKWNVKEEIEKRQEKLKGVEEKRFGVYNVVDINNYTEEELWEEKSLLSRMLLLEKAKKENKMEEYFKRIEKEKYSKEQLNIIGQMFYNLMQNNLEEGTIKEYLEKIKSKKGGKEMSAFEEYVENLIIKSLKQGKEEGIIEGKREGKREGRREGKIEGIIQTAKKMLQRNMEIDEIEEITGIKKEELENIKSMLV